MVYSIKVIWCLKYYNPALSGKQLFEQVLLKYLLRLKRIRTLLWVVFEDAI